MNLTFMENKRYEKKIICYTFFIVIITVLICYALQVTLMNSFYYYRKEKEMLNIRENIVKLYSDKDNRDSLFQYLDKVKDKDEIHVRLFNLNNELISIENRDFLNLLNILPNKEFKTIHSNKTGKKSLFYTEILDQNNILFLRTSYSIFTSYQKEMDIFHFVTALFSIIITSVLGVFFSKKLTGDIEILMRKTKKIAALDFSDDREFSEKVVKRDDEIGELGNNIMIMSQNLYEAIGSLELFVGNASHELKTPIAVLLATLETLMRSNHLSEEERKKKYEILIVETRGLKELLEDLLLLSKIRSLGYNLQKKEILLKDIIEKSIGKFELLELEKDIDVMVNLKNEKILCDERLFKIAMDNIIQNAFKYSTFGGTLKIYIKENILYIRNTSEEIIKNADKIFEPFIRGVEESNSTEGTGLGLSIIKKSLDINMIRYCTSLEKDEFIFKIFL